MKISVVTSLYNSENYIDLFIDSINKICTENLRIDYEIVFIDDGSTDNSFNKAKYFAENDKRIKLIGLSRNFGHHNALIAGLDYVSGDYIYVTDIDLDEKPEWLIDYYQSLIENEVEIVQGIDASKKRFSISNVFKKIFYLVIKLFGINYPKNYLLSVLFSRKFLNEFKKYKEYSFNFLGVLQQVGFERHLLKFEKENSALTSYTFNKKTIHMIRSLFSFDNKLLISIFNFGILNLLFSIVFVFYLIIRYIGPNPPLGGWVSTIASIWIFGSVLIIFIGMIGMYLSIIFDEVKKRPLAIVKEFVNIEE
tara:strand:- start:2354 stop:3277 length:924 start_codon:yes stop_codon:yes gene_type:complete